MNTMLDMFSPMRLRTLRHVGLWVPLSTWMRSGLIITIHTCEKIWSLYIFWFVSTMPKCWEHHTPLVFSLCSRPARFKKRGRKWYNWTEKECEEHWTHAIRDPATPKGRDQLLVFRLCQRMESTANTSFQSFFRTECCVYRWSIQVWKLDGGKSGIFAQRSWKLHYQQEKCSGEVLICLGMRVWISFALSFWFHIKLGHSLRLRPAGSSIPQHWPRRPGRDEGRGDKQGSKFWNVLGSNLFITNLMACKLTYQTLKQRSEFELCFFAKLEMSQNEAPFFLLFEVMLKPKRAPHFETYRSRNV